ncbi:MAG: hypothetical protein OEV78_11600 [Spirochaetia bacterium]|nr:hypothetical protein [Spirochaetia bacterium]
MDSILTIVVVTGVFLLLTSATGNLLGKSGKPYSNMKLVFHIALFVIVTAGLVMSFLKLQETSVNKLYSTISLYVAGFALIINAIIGSRLKAAVEVNPKMVIAHKLATFLLTISIISTIVFLYKQM